MDGRHEDYAELPPSPRSLLAQAMPGLLDEAGLDAGPVMREEGGRYYYCTFAKGTGFLGEVRVYGPDYFAVQVEGQGFRVLESPENVFAYVGLMLAGKRDEAAMIPERPVKRRKKARPQDAASGCDPERPLPVSEGMFGEGADDGIPI
jgi:hypothetical protein